MSKRGRVFFIMDLARELKMTRRQLLHNLDSYELSMWEAYFKEVNKKQTKKQDKHEVEGSIKNFFMSKVARK